ncbi:MAG: excinuclease ABC subunit UvrC [Deltaproteobacteria bacterium]|nr:excinuclease ABC subunit UvrC [Deltaproteobacteria bacterium]
MDIESTINSLPRSPGVYIMKGARGAILYIGKAKSLRSRVQSYFRPSPSGDQRYAVRFLASKAEGIEFIVTANEKEAFLLEDTLIKKEKPRYNIQLKDSKTYVSIKLSLPEKFPRISATRQIKKDGSRYFGPYVSGRAVREAIKFIRRIFPLCTCSPAVFRNRARPCLDYQLGLCPAPAVGKISEEAYRGLVDGAIMFLEGRNRELLRVLKGWMREAAGHERFEEAARLRDRVSAIEEMLEEQKVVAHGGADRDVFGLARGGGVMMVQTLHIRGGRLCGGADFAFEDAGLPGAEVLSGFLAQFYRGERFIPREVIVPFRLEDAAVITGWLGAKKSGRVVISAPQRGERLALCRMAATNAAEALRVRSESRGASAGVLAALKERLRLKAAPAVIEAFDISNIGGSLAVGAMAVFRDGQPDKASYRLYRIKGVEGPDDYAMMREVLSRRYRDANPPDLILIDGGKGQLNIALRVLAELGIKDAEVAALAKDKPAGQSRFAQARRPSKGERIFRPNVKDPVLLREGTPEDLLLRRIRDEVHRFAIGYHRRLRSKDAASSVLDAVLGIGAKRRRALYERFVDLGGILSASEAELASVPGITPEMAAAIKKTAAGGTGP